MSETRFRKSKVIPFLLSLRHTAFFPIQQLAIMGDADYIACTRGLFIWCELKAEGEKLRPLQLKKAHWVLHCGGIVLRAAPETWDVVSNWWRHFDKTGENLPCQLL